MNPVHAARQPSFAQRFGPDEIRRKVNAELAEVKDHLAAYAFQGPKAQCIYVWYENFTKRLRHPDPQKVVQEFVKVLPDIFKNPLRPEAPFEPELFGDEQPDLIRFMVQKMRDPKSLFFSQEVAEAAPPPPQPTPQAVPDDRAEQIRQLDAIWAARKRRENPENDILRNLEKGLGEKLTEQANYLAMLSEKVQKVFDKKTSKKDALQKHIRKEGKAIKATAIRLKKEASLERDEVRRLRAEARKLKDEDVQDLKKENIELKADIKEVSAANKEAQSKWLEDLAGMVMSIAASCILNEILPGASAVFIP